MAEYGEIRKSLDKENSYVVINFYDFFPRVRAPFIGKFVAITGYDSSSGAVVD